MWGRSDTAWQQTLDVDLRAVMEGVRLAARAMLTGSPTGGRGGARSSEARITSSSPCIMITASAGGTFPMPASPVYAATKAGCIQLTRSMAGPLAKQGVRICALCPQARLGRRVGMLAACWRAPLPLAVPALPLATLPANTTCHIPAVLQFTDTALVRGLQQGNPAQAAEVMRDTGGRVLRVEQVGAATRAAAGGWDGRDGVKRAPSLGAQPSDARHTCRLQVTQAGLALLEDGSKVGTCLVVLVDGGWVEPQRTRFKSGAPRCGVGCGGAQCGGEPPCQACVILTICCPAHLPHHTAVEKPASAEAARVDPALRAWATAALPADSTRVIEVHTLSADFRAATRIARRPLTAVLPPGHVLIRCGRRAGMQAESWGGGLRGTPQACTHPCASCCAPDALLRRMHGAPPAGARTPASTPATSTTLPAATLAAPPPPPPSCPSPPGLRRWAPWRPPPPT